ncbi:MAG: TIGR03915 family putative DNA repair protein [Lachnospiraceae bacterium]|nr:TIGR03915 family putative DNA repair protein [Lachnospiraceae bacterium]
MPEKCLLCEDSLEGILTGVYEAYRCHFVPQQTRLQCGEVDNYRLFTEYISIETEAEKAKKVMRTLRERMGEETFQAICRAASSADSRKADAIYHTIVKGLLSRRPSQIMGDLADDAVRTVFELSRNVLNEAHHFKEFLRFEELENGVLFARIGAVNDIVVYLAPHFADRLPGENFMIYDEKHELLVIHPAGKEWYVQRLWREKENSCGDSSRDRNGEPFIARESLVYSDREKEYQELFRYFCHKIAIESRRNERLQQQMLPLRFQSYMPEFQQK